MISFMNDFFGSYEPLIFIDDEGISHAINGAAGVDWSYVCSVALFCVFIICTFKIIGKFFGGRLH